MSYKEILSGVIMVFCSTACQQVEQTKVEIGNVRRTKYPELYPVQQPVCPFRTVHCICRAEVPNFTTETSNLEAPAKKPEGHGLDSGW
jgi:hypothetical protein